MGVLSLHGQRSRPYACYKPGTGKTPVGHRLGTIENGLDPKDLTQLFLVRPARFERATPAFGGQYSIQLSYGRYEPRSIAGLADRVYPQKDA